MSDLFKALAGLEALNTPEPRTLPARKAAPVPHPVASTPLGWTAEQRAVIEMDAARVQAVALAGTGKTQVLFEYARRRPRARWRYLTFSRALADDASNRAPAHVRAGTFHGLAHARFGAPLGGKLRQRFHADAVRRAVGWERFPGWEAATAALREWRRGFLASADPLPALRQIPPQAWAWLVAQPGLLAAVGGATGFVAAAEKLWAATLDPLQTDVDAPGEVPVKLMALAGMDWGADGLLIDEAQDLTPCLADALARQKASAVLVGDPAQALYAWRGAGAAWPDPGRGEVQALTGSWRFGPDVAAAANTRLERLGRSERLVGKHSDSTLTESPVSWRAGLTWVARTQAGAVEGALAAVAAGHRPRWIGRGGLDRLTALIDLAQGRPVRDPWLAGLNRIEDVARVAREAGALEWRAAARLVCQRSAAQLEAAVTGLSTGAGDVAVSTVHQAKGQTFDRVALADDLRWDDPDEGEQRVNYVALTRSAHLQVAPGTPARWAVSPSASSAPTLDWDDGF